jgi:hypothetical protein
LCHSSCVIPSAAEGPRIFLNARRLTPPPVNRLPRHPPIATFSSCHSERSEESRILLPLSRRERIEGEGPYSERFARDSRFRSAFLIQVGRNLFRRPRSPFLIQWGGPPCPPFIPERPSEIPSSNIGGGSGWRTTVRRDCVLPRTCGYFHALGEGQKEVLSAKISRDRWNS